MSIVSKIFFTFRCGSPMSSPTLSQSCANLSGTIFSIFSAMFSIFIYFFALCFNEFIEFFLQFFSQISGFSVTYRMFFYAIYRQNLHNHVRQKDLISVKQIGYVEVFFDKFNGIFLGALKNSFS